MGYDKFLMSEVTFVPDNYIALDEETSEKVMGLIDITLEGKAQLLTDKYGTEYIDTNVIRWERDCFYVEQAEG